MVASTSSVLKPVVCHFPCQVCRIYSAKGFEVSRFLNSSYLMPLPGLVKPVRTVAFSPAGKLLAAAGDSKVIVLFDTSSGEQVANLSGHSAWILSLAWSTTGEYLLSG